MRPELEQLQQIDKYLNNELSAADRAAFEAQLAADPNLREELRLQTDLRAALQRASLTASIRRAKQHYYRSNFLKWGGISLGAILVICILLVTTSRHHQAAGDNTAAGRTQAPPAEPATSAAQPVPGQPSYGTDSLPAANESGQPRWSAADSNLAAQTFWLSGIRDTVIETKAGIVLSIPAAAFLDANHQIVKGTIELVIKEALDAASILKSGLSTRAGDQLLETGGMFFVDARQKGKPLSIDSARGIYAEIPTNNVRPGMQLFTGKRLANGIIDWTNPRPLEHDLMPVDIHLLNFYPPHYLDSVNKWGYDRGNRTFTDSLYYAFSYLFSDSEGAASAVIDTTASSATRIATRNTFIARDTLLPADMSRMPRTNSASDSAKSWCDINPAKIAAIWNDHFQNTLIATREFEQRLILIHQTGDDKLLDLYVNHLDLNLCTIDSMAADQTTGITQRRFLAFAARHDGKVKHGDTRFDKLREYYQLKAKAFAEAVTKTTREFWAKETQLDDSATNRALSHRNDSIDRLNRNFTAELRVNLKSAFTQLGYNYRVDERAWIGTTISAPASYKANITRTGWCNIDACVIEQTIARQTIDYQDVATGKRAVITYNSVYFKFTTIRAYDRAYLYLLPDKLNSFMRLDTDSTGTFTEKLNSEMTYRLVVIAWQKEQAFYYSQTNIQPTTYTPIPVVPISAADLDNRLQHLGNATQIADLKKEQEYLSFEFHDRPRQARDQMLRDLTNKMINAFFPCRLGDSYGNVKQAEGAK